LPQNKNNLSNDEIIELSKKPHGRLLLETHHSYWRIKRLANNIITNDSEKIEAIRAEIHNWDLVGEKEYRLGVIV
jgi:hypothetical protein